MYMHTNDQTENVNSYRCCIMGTLIRKGLLHIIL